MKSHTGHHPNSFTFALANANDERFWLQAFRKNVLEIKRLVSITIIFYQFSNWNFTEVNLERVFEILALCTAIVVSWTVTRSVARGFWCGRAFCGWSNWRTFSSCGLNVGFELCFFQIRCWENFIFMNPWLLFLRHFLQSDCSGPFYSQSLLRMSFQQRIEQNH